MESTSEALPSIPLLRLKVATNLFKLLLLGEDLHIAGNPQISAVFDALMTAGCKKFISEKTWRLWFSETGVVPKIDKLKALDAFAAMAMRVPGQQGISKVSLPSGTFSTLVHGGLVRQLTAPSQAKKLLPVLLARAIEYEPVSPLHLHLDAMEIGALSDDFEDIPWATVKAIGAERIMDILTDRWSPRHGTIYATLSSDLRLKWQNAGEEERHTIQQNYAHFKPDLFQYFMDRTPQPDWEKVGIEPNISSTQIHKALFSLAADPRFLVADRLSTWSLDLATAALAMHAYAWTDRYETFGYKVTQEMNFWGAFDAILFEDNEPSFDQFDVIPAMAATDAEWSNESVEALLLGRESYRTKLENLGVSAAEIRSIAMRGAKAHPLVYHSSKEAWRG